MIDDYDLEFSKREQRLARERDYWADRYRDSRLWRRESEIDRDRRLSRDRLADDDRLEDRAARDRALAREEDQEDDIEEARIERRLFGIAGFGMGGGGAVLVVLGIVLMAIAYFGFGLFDGGYGAAYAGGYDAADGYSPAAGLYPSASGASFGGGFGGGYGGGGDLLSQRQMMFMGGGVVFLAGWIAALTSRIRGGFAD